MNQDDQLTADILAALECLPFDQQADGMRGAISHALKYMSTTRLRAIRDRIEADLDDTIPAVRTTLEVIEGQIALRDIADGAYWR